MGAQMQTENKIRLYSIYTGIILVYSGTVQNVMIRIAGGFVSVLLAYVVFLFSVCSGLEYREKDRILWHSAMWYIIFSVIYIFGMEMFCTENDAVDILSCSVKLPTYHILKSLPLWLLGFIAAAKRESTELDGLCRLISFLFIWGMSASIWVLSLEPNYVRIRTAGENPGWYALSGAMGYGLSYSVPVVFISVFMVIWKKKKFMAYLFFLLCVIYTVKCSLFLAAAALCLNILLSLISGIRTTVLRITCTMMILGAVFWAVKQRMWLGNILIDGAEFVSDANLSMRMEQIGKYFRFGVHGPALKRFQMYKNSLGIFLSSPWIGAYPLNKTYVISGHSAVLDILSSFGLLAAFPFSASFFSLYLFIRNRIQNQWMKRIVRSAILTFSFVAVCNPVLSNVQILFSVFCVLPVFAQQYDSLTLERRNNWGAEPERRGERLFRLKIRKE